ncbi:MAG: TonB-dependent receptor [Rubricoccaceae bacterium]
MRVRALLLPALVGLATSASAQTASDTLGAVTVTAARVAVATAEAPARVMVLGREAMEAVGASTVADVLEARSAVFLKRYGPGGLASLSLRGTGAAQTLVLLDGHRIADPQLGQLDVSLLPSALVETVEVAHGPGSALHGTDGIGGVIQLRTPVASATRARLDLRTGAWGERGGGLMLSGRAGDFGAIVALDRDFATGDYLYTDSTRFDASSQTFGVTSPRSNADVRRDALFARISRASERHDGSLGVWASDAERGLFAFSGPAVARQHDRALRLWTDHSLRFGTTTVQVGGLAQRSSLQYTNPSIAVDDTGETTSASGRVQLDRVWTVAGGAWRLSGGAEARTARAEHPSLSDTARETASSLFTSGVLDYGRVIVYPALRLDRISTPIDTAEVLMALSPQFGLNLQPTRWRGLRLKASVGRAFRAPTFNDRFWQPGGDPGLRSERGWTADVGVMTSVRAGDVSLSAEASAFASALRDQIVWRPGRFPDGFYWAPQNIGTTRTRGLELSSTLRLASATRFAEIGGLVTVADARDRTDPEASSFDQPLLYVPNRLVRAHAATGWRGLRLDLGAQHTGRRWTASDGSASLPPVTVLNLGLAGTLSLPGVAATLAVRAENLLDARYAIVRQYPMPPRHLRLRLTLTSR